MKSLGRAPTVGMPKQSEQQKQQQEQQQQQVAQSNH
jgi:hypothetical protein